MPVSNLFKRRRDLITVSITTEEIYNWHNTLRWQEDRSTAEFWHEDNIPSPIEEALKYELPKAKSISISPGYIIIQDPQGKMLFPTTYKLLTWISALDEGSTVEGIRLTIGYNKEGNPEADIATYLEEV